MKRLAGVNEKAECFYTMLISCWIHLCLCVPFGELDSTIKVTEGDRLHSPTKKDLVTGETGERRFVLSVGKCRKVVQELKGQSIASLLNVLDEHE
jgi:hypothetical protein